MVKDGFTIKANNSLKNVCPIIIIITKIFHTPYRSFFIKQIETNARFPRTAIDKNDIVINAPVDNIIINFELCVGHFCLCHFTCFYQLLQTTKKTMNVYDIGLTLYAILEDDIKKSLQV